jgi:hypothetical protein
MAECTRILLLINDDDIGSDMTRRHVDALRMYRASARGRLMSLRCHRQRQLVQAKYMIDTKILSCIYLYYICSSRVIAMLYPDIS